MSSGNSTLKVLMIVSIGAPLSFVFDVAAALVLCGLKAESIPALPIANFIQRDTVYNYFIHFYATFKLSPRGDVDDPMSLLHVAGGQGQQCIGSSTTPRV